MDTTLTERRRFFDTATTAIHLLYTISVLHKSFS